LKSATDLLFNVTLVRTFPYLESKWSGRSLRRSSLYKKRVAWITLPSIMPSALASSRPQLIANRGVIRGCDLFDKPYWEGYD
jgi:hypothetical protein